MDATTLIQWGVGQGVMGVFLALTWQSLGEVQKRELKRVEEYAEAHRVDKKEMIETLKNDERRYAVLESKIDTMGAKLDAIVRLVEGNRGTRNTRQRE